MLRWHSAEPPLGGLQSAAVQHSPLTQLPPQQICPPLQAEPVAPQRQLPLWQVPALASHVTPSLAATQPCVTSQVWHSVQLHVWQVVLPVPAA